MFAARRVSQLGKHSAVSCSCHTRRGHCDVERDCELKQGSGIGDIHGSVVPVVARLSLPLTIGGSILGSKPIFGTF